MQFAGFCLMCPEKSAVIGFDVIKGLYGDEQVAAVISHLAFHVSFFPAGTGVAETGLKVVVRPEFCKQR